MEKIFSKIKLRYFLPLPIILVIISVIMFFSGGSGGNPKFFGSFNYLKLFISDDTFWIALTNTIKSSFSLVFGALFFGFIIAFLLAKLPRIIKFTISGLLLLFSLYLSARLIFASIFNVYDYINSLLLKFGVIKTPTETFLLKGNTSLFINCFLIFSLLGIVVAIIIAGFEHVEYTLKKTETLSFKRSYKRLFTYIPKLSIFPYVAGTIVLFLGVKLSSIINSIIGFPASAFSSRIIINQISNYNKYIKPQINISAIIFNILFLTIVFLVIYLVGVIFKKLVNKIKT